MIDIDSAIGLLLEQRYLKAAGILANFTATVMKELQTQNFSTALKCLDEEYPNIAGVMANETTLSYELQKLYTNLSNYLDIRGLTQEKLVWGLRFLAHSRKKRSLPDVLVLNSLATVCYQSGNYREAIAVNRQIILISKLRDESTLASFLMGVYANMAITHWKLDEKAQALEYVERAVELRHLQNDPVSTAMALSTLSEIYTSNRQREQGLKLALEALESSLQTDHVYLQVNILNTVAAQLMVNGKISDSFKAYEYLEQLYHELGDPIGLAKTKFNLARVHFAAHDLALAVRIATESLEIFEQEQQVVLVDKVRNWINLHTKGENDNH